MGDSCVECGGQHFGLRHGQWLHALERIESERIRELERDLKIANDDRTETHAWLKRMEAISDDHRNRAERAERERDGWQEIALRVQDGALFYRQRAELVEAALDQCWQLMERSEGRVSEELYAILEPLRTALADAPAPAREGEGDELVQPRVQGKPFRCNCGANVFRRLSPARGLPMYRCNACGQDYEAWAIDEPGAAAPAEESDGGE